MLQAPQTFGLLSELYTAHCMASCISGLAFAQLLTAAQALADSDPWKLALAVRSLSPTGPPRRF